MKDNLLKTQNRVLDKLHDKIINQDGEDSTFSVLNVFDLTSRESLEDKLQKISQLFCISGEYTTHYVEEEWFGFKVKLTYINVICYTSNIQRLRGVVFCI